ncbi:biopolymer transport protein ExbB [Novimethylophilus kurashikiensis]|uniref:Biopolymer transport protein ExbB n=1 Tax=Novimethylophilus kurashikiensis TaxID=1825523 RepID=A0A2R5F6C3_9PROT|nr:MotA/TolQ/ExbB proton channel family protein [Novimethylophilus kurashikiensis]GBG13787.1 biopolymer transport protein ExbB [Novimethylophilus kurashikiensis]
MKHQTRDFALTAVLYAATAVLAFSSPWALADISTTANAAKETVANPYGLDALWKGGDFVARGTLLILVAMSAGSWYVIVTKLFEQYKLGRHAREANATFWTAGGLQQAVDGLNPESAYHYLAKSGVEATAHHNGLLGQIDFNTWVSQSIQRAIDNIQSRLQDGLAFLGTVGSTAPFVGLFGTVWGIYHALTAIGIAGQASIDKVAGPVGEALIMTAIGLAVAVPAVLGYNWLVRRNKASLDNIRAFGADLHAVLLGAGVETAKSAAQTTATVKASVAPVRVLAAANAN